MKLDLKCIIMYIVLLILVSEYFKWSRIENMNNYSSEVETVDETTDENVNDTIDRMIVSIIELNA